MLKHWAFCMILGQQLSLHIPQGGWVASRTSSFRGLVGFIPAVGSNQPKPSSPSSHYFNRLRLELKFSHKHTHTHILDGGLAVVTPVLCTACKLAWCFGNRRPKPRSKAETKINHWSTVSFGSDGETESRASTTFFVFVFSSRTRQSQDKKQTRKFGVGIAAGPWPCLQSGKVCEKGLAQTRPGIGPPTSRCIVSVVAAG